MHFGWTVKVLALLSLFNLKIQTDGKNHMVKNEVPNVK